MSAAAAPWSFPRSLQQVEVGSFSYLPDSMPVSVVLYRSIASKSLRRFWLNFPRRVTGEVGNTVICRTAVPIAHLDSKECFIQSTLQIHERKGVSWAYIGFYSNAFDFYLISTCTSEKKELEIEMQFLSDVHVHLECLLEKWRYRIYINQQTSGRKVPKTFEVVELLLSCLFRWRLLFFKIGIIVGRSTGKKEQMEKLRGITLVKYISNSLEFGFPLASLSQQSSGADGGWQWSLSLDNGLSPIAPFWLSMLLCLVINKRGAPDGNLILLLLFCCPLRVLPSYTNWKLGYTFVLEQFWNFCSF